MTTPRKSQTTPCRCCGQPMAHVTWTLGENTMILVTCENTACVLVGYTFTTRDYAEKDLRLYMGARAK
jgi:hypothetical protein